jgi:hypothetical protein
MRECGDCHLLTNSLVPYCLVCGRPSQGLCVVKQVPPWRVALTLLLPFRLLAMLLA